MEKTRGSKISSKSTIRSTVGQAVGEVGGKVIGAGLGAGGKVFGAGGKVFGAGGKALGAGGRAIGNSLSLGTFKRKNAGTLSFSVNVKKTTSKKTTTIKAQHHSQQFGVIASEEDAFDIIQNGIFEDETLVLVKVVKKIKSSNILWNKKQVQYFLCITANEQDVLTIQFVKSTPESLSFKKGRELESLKSLELADDKGEFAFSLGFKDKTYYWATNTADERTELIWTMFELCRECVGQMPNTSINILELKLLSDSQVPTNPGDIARSYKDFMSPSEEKELEYLLKTYGNLDELNVLANQLNSNLNNLEMENVCSLIEAESSIEEVIKKLNTASYELEEVDQWLNYYNQQLAAMRQYIDSIELKNDFLELSVRNQNSLVDEISNLMHTLEVDQEFSRILQEGSFQLGQPLQEMCRAAELLGQVLQTGTSSSGYGSMSCVKEKISEFLQLKQIFSTRITKFMKDYISKLKSKSETEERFSLELLKRGHSYYYENLYPYTPLIHWLRDNDPKIFEDLLSTYVITMKGVYKRDFRQLHEELKKYVVKDMRLAKILESFKYAELSRPEDEGPDFYDSVPTTFCKVNASKAFGFYLALVVHLVKLEIEFVKVFWEKPNSTKSSSKSVYDMILEEIFENLLNEFKPLIDFADKTNQLQLIHINVQVNRYLLSDTVANHNFLKSFLQTLINSTKQAWNRFIDEEIAGIKSYQITAKRCGILPYVSCFPKWLENVERLTPFDGRSVIESTYFKIVSSIFALINQKGDTPEDKFQYIVRIENYHHFFNKLKDKDILCLEKNVEESKSNYEQNLTQFIDYTMNRQFDKLMKFFDGIDELLKTVPAEEIPFQSSHSKQAVNRILERYDKLGFAKRFQKVYLSYQKNFCKEEALVNTAWISFKDRIRDKYHHIGKITANCYKITSLPVSYRDLDDVLREAERVKLTTKV